jgi:hypothetical protein
MNNKTDNDTKGFSLKVSIRRHVVKKMQNISVLDCYSGHGWIWKEVKKTNNNITTTQIDTRDDKSGIYLKGDNSKFLGGMDLSTFNVVDLDSYGVPVEQLAILFDRNYKGVVFFTFIQSNRGRLPNQMLFNIGYTPEMVKKIPTLFNKNGFDKFYKWLFLNGICEINYINHKRKYYGYFHSK